MLERIYSMQALQLVDSELATTRRYWRRDVWGFPDEVADDPRPMKEVWPNWREPDPADMPDLPK